ncbi:MAG TPA: DUF2892 domain-containing protein [Thermoanaerobaculia bacterium]|nr:DUF2892 domain-containing protein [Thermoanaerobaculia bacterium]
MEHGTFTEHHVNVPPAERVLSALAGGALLVGGLRRGSLGRSLLGAALVLRGASGHCPVRHLLEVDAVERHATPEFVDSLEHQRR